MESFQGKGFYRHHEGPLYSVIGIAFNKDTKEKRVIYHPVISDGTDMEYDYYMDSIEDFNAIMKNRIPRFHIINR